MSNVKVTMTDPVSRDVVATSGPCAAAEADRWTQQQQAAHPDVDLIPTVERVEVQHAGWFGYDDDWLDPWSFATPIDKPVSGVIVVDAQADDLTSN